MATIIGTVIGRHHLLYCSYMSAWLMNQWSQSRNLTTLQALISSITIIIIIQATGCLEYEHSDVLFLSCRVCPRWFDLSGWNRMQKIWLFELTLSLQSMEKLLCSLYEEIKKLILKKWFIYFQVNWFTKLYYYCVWIWLAGISESTLFGIDSQNISCELIAVWRDRNYIQNIYCVFFYDSVAVTKRYCEGKIKA